MLAVEVETMRLASDLLLIAALLPVVCVKAIARRIGRAVGL